MDKWISVKDQLPEGDQHVIVAKAGGEPGGYGDWISLAFFDHTAQRFQWLNWQANEQPSHWFPLPPFPGEEGGKRSPSALLATTRAIVLPLLLFFTAPLAAADLRWPMGWFQQIHEDRAVSVMVATPPPEAIYLSPRDRCDHFLAPGEVCEPVTPFEKWRTPLRNPRGENEFAVFIVILRDGKLVSEREVRMPLTLDTERTFTVEAKAGDFVGIEFNPHLLDRLQCESDPVHGADHAKCCRFYRCRSVVIDGSRPVIGHYCNTSNAWRDHASTSCWFDLSRN